MKRSKLFGLGLSSMLALTSVMQSAQAQTATTGTPSGTTTVVVVKVSDNAGEREAARRLLSRSTKTAKANAQQVNGQGTGASGASAPSAIPADPVAEATAAQIRSQTAIAEDQYRHQRTLEQEQARTNNEVMLRQARVAEQQAATDDSIRSGYALNDLQNSDLERQERIRQARNQDTELTYAWMRDSTDSFQTLLFNKQALAFGNVALDQRLIDEEGQFAAIQSQKEWDRLNRAQQAVGPIAGSASPAIGGIVDAIWNKDERDHDKTLRADMDARRTRLSGQLAKDMQREDQATDAMADNLAMRAKFLEARFKALADERVPLQQRPLSQGSGAPSQRP